MRLLVDTNRYVDFDRGDLATLQRWELANELWFPFVVLGELRAGFQIGAKGAQNERALRELLDSRLVGVLWPDDETTLVYAALAKKLRRKGTPIPTNDLWIAALAIQHNLELDTRDGHFRKVPGLRRAG